VPFSSSVSARKKANVYFSTGSKSIRTGIILRSAREINASQKDAETDVAIERCGEERVFTGPGFRASKQG
jgi:hypothetical protein